MTRRELIEDLFKKLEKGPAVSEDVKHQLETGNNFGFPNLSIEEVDRKWRLWLDTWVTLTVHELLDKEYTKTKR